MEIFNEDFWRKKAADLFDIVFKYIYAAILGGIAGGESALVSLGITILPSWEITNAAAEQFARSYSFELVSGIQNTSRAYLQDTIGDWIQSGDPLPVLTEKINAGGYFGPVRSEMIAVTETTRAYAEGNREYWNNTGVVDGKTWRTAFDDVVCELCIPLEGATAPLNGWTWTNPAGETIETDPRQPPRHVNCRCWIQPIVSK
jgi:hypothetical protein